MKIVPLTTNGNANQPPMPPHARELPNGVWYAEDGPTEEFQEHEIAAIIHRSDLANAGWFYRHLVIGVKSKRVAIIEAKRTPWSGDCLLQGDIVGLSWTSRLHLTHERQPANVQ